MLALVAVPVIGRLIPVKYIPFLSFALSLLLFSFIRKNRRSRTESCAIVPYISARALLGFTVFSFTLIFIYFGTKGRLGEALMFELQDHSILYLSVVHLFVVFFVSRARWNNTFCSDCLLRNGLPQEREKLGHIYVKEKRYLLNRLMKVSGLVLVLSLFPVFWGADRLNSQVAVNLIYVYIPLFIVVADSFYIRFRYFIVDKIQKKENSLVFPYNGQFKLIRILLFDNDGIYFVEKNGQKDTPFEFYEPFVEKVSSHSAKRFMEDALGFFVSNDDLRFCYGTADPDNRRCIEHYLCYVDSRQATASFERQKEVEGIWLTKQDLESGFQHGFSGIVCSEFHRIYTVMQTSKVYLPNGKRRVDIKGYSPHFTLSELRTTDVDFSDNRWMLLSRFNKDMAFYSLKRAWHQYIEGLK